MSNFAGSEVAKTRSRVAVAARVGSPDDIAEAQRAHAAAKLSSYISKIVAEAPPLNADQRARIAALLAPTEGASK